MDVSGEQWYKKKHSDTQLVAWHENPDAMSWFATIEICEYLITWVPVNGECGKCQNLFYDFVSVHKLIIIIEWGANRGH